MRVFSVYPEPAGIAPRIVDLMIGALTAEGATIWLVSPWMTDFDFDLQSRGVLLPYFGSERTSVTFCELVKLVARRNQVSVLLRPPHVLIGRGDLARTVELLRARAALAPAADDSAVRAALALLEHETERIASSAVSQRGTIEFARTLRRHANISVRFNPRLHAKIVTTPAAALVGSANLTWSGMNSNDEIMVQVDEPSAIAQLGAMARAMSLRRFCSGAGQYNFIEQLPASERAAVNELLESPLTPASLVQLVRDCMGFV